LYYYYPSKDDVFYAVINKERIEVTETLTTAIKYQKSPAAQLRAFFLARFYEVKRRINLYSVMLQENGKHTALFTRIQRESNTAELEMMKKILFDGINAGEFKSITKDDCESLAVAGIMMQRGLEANIILSGALPPEELRLETTIEVFIRGLR
jgi:AcrR family transcriptional regulator